VSTALDDIARFYDRDIVDAGKQPHFFILVAFLITFVIVRLITHTIRGGRVHFLHDVTAGGRHIHHLVWGILLLLATGYVAIAFDPHAPHSRELLAVLFGIGAALALDEFALWLNLRDVYWAKEGRASVDAVVIVSIIFGIFVVGQRFWLDVGRVFADVTGIT
jgi:hypothetical protein